MGTRAWVMVVLGLAGAASAQGPGGEDAGPPPALVRVGLVEVQTLQKRWDVIGQLREVRQSIVAAEVAGKVVQVAVEEGDPVVGGETVLARIDGVWAQTQLAKAEADLAAAHGAEAEAKAQLDKSQSDLDELTKLMQQRAAKQRELNDAKARRDADAARLAQAVAGVRAAEAQRDRSQSEVDRLIVLAPFDGVVVRKMIEVGEWAEVGSSVAQIVSRGQIDAVINVPESLVNQVEVGAPMAVYVEPLGTEFVGRVRAVIPMGESASRTFPVKVRLNDQGGELKAGMSVVARVPTGQRADLLTVPRDAVLRTPTGSVVWAVLDDRAVRIPVEVLFGHKDRYAVRPRRRDPDAVTLAAQMPVVIEGAERILFPGQPAQVVSETAPGAEADADGEPASGS
ncbi:MAG: efflux RND transporter periplasmic adaptor subunit [Phycisphaeraceae bacterium]